MEPINIIHNKEQRDEYIDLLRGIAIIDMILIHYSYLFPDIVKKIFNYHDIAMEGFLFLSGLTIGRYYFGKFKINKLNITNKLILRSLKIILIQYVMIITISLPQYIILNRITDINSYIRFLSKSFMFYNQIGLMHILPTFIPLFLISPIILLGFYKGFDLIIIISSICLFFIGQAFPGIFDFGERTIFPVILWQIYFVAGCYMGKFIYNHNNISINKKWFIIVTGILFIIALGFKHVSSLSIIIKYCMDSHGVYINRFPLNFYGLLYGSFLWSFIISFTYSFGSIIKKFTIIKMISLIGRHSLLSFVIHVYFAKTIEIIRDLHINTHPILIYIIAILNILITINILMKYEVSEKELTKGKGRLIRWIFN